CTTTSKKVTTGYSVEPVSQLEKATMAFKQKNYPLAAKLLAPLAKEGQDYAQYALGYMYYNGMGVPRNRSIANQLLNASASNGNKNAIKALRLISSDANGASSTTKKVQPLIVEKVESDIGPEDVSEAMLNTPVINRPKNNPSIGADNIEIDNIEKTADVALVQEQQPVEKQPAAMPEKISSNLEALTESEKWIIAQPDTNYTIQLLVSGNEAAMQRYIIDNKLQDVAIYNKSVKDGANLYVLIQGSFEEFSQATKAIASLSPEVQMAKPWVRSIAVIKKALLAR
ncbi:MAG: SEL1-like repeat protein, partial [Gammaproteobacteria bacterium]|nr:SEL1-like repeat protein [Gammaproteobacteria bacterium]